ncbi:MAG: PAS domain S-box protein [Burkholderiales bacterium]
MAEEKGPEAGAPATPGQLRSWSRLRWIIAVCGALLIAGVATAVIRDGRNEALGKGEATVRTLAHVIEAHTRHAFATVELSLGNIENTLRLAARDRPARAADLQALMKAMASRQPQVRAYFIVDERGMVVYASDPLPAAPLDFSGRNFFHVHQSNAGHGIHIDASRASQATGETFVSVSRRIDRPDGGFGGVVVAAIEPDYFQNFYTEVNHGRDGAIALFLRDGTLLFRGPAAAQVAGRAHAGVEPFSSLLATALRGVYHASSAIDGVDRIFAYRVLDGLPLVVVAGVSERELLAGWQREIGTVLLLALAVVAAIAGLTVFLVREMRRRETLAAVLRENERRYRYLFEVNPHPLWVYDTETLRFLAVNDATVETYGYSRAEFLAMTALDIRPAEDIARFRRLVSTLDPKLNQSGIWRHRKKDGTVFEAEVVSHGFEFEGRPARLVLAQDISAKVRAEQELRESEQRYRYLFESSPLPMWVRENDTLRFLAVNEATVETYGYSREEFQSMTVADLRLPEDVPAYLETAKARDPLADSHDVVRHRRKDGTVFDAEVTSRPFELGGRLVRLTVVNDITERRRAEQALRESEERFRAIFEQAAVGMALRDIDPRNPRWLRVNQKLCAILGYTREELLQLSSVDITPPEDREAATGYNEQLVRGDIASYSREKRYVRKNGEIIWVNISLSVMRGPSGAPACIISVVRDITEHKRAEQALRESEERYRRVFEMSPSPMLLRRGETVIFANPAALKFFGADSAAQLVGRPLFDLLHPDEWNDVRQRMVRISEGGSVPAMVRRFLRLDGGEVMGETSGAALKYQGDMLGIVTIHDITDRNAAEAALRHSEARLRTITDNIPALIGHIGADGRYLFLNRTYEDWYGRAREEALGRTMREVLGDAAYRHVSPHIETALSGKAVSIERWSLSTVHRIFARFTYLPDHDAQGRVVGCYILGYDITERKQAEEALLREQALLRAVIDNLPDFIYVKDRNGRFLLVNPAWFQSRGMSAAEEVLGKTVFDYFPAPQARQLDEEDRAIIETGKPVVNRELLMTDEAGRKEWRLTTKVPLRDPQGDIIGLVGITRNITEIRQSAETIRKLNAELEQRVIERTAQLAAANRELESFAYSVSHDLRAPLRSIDGFSQALLEDYRERLDATGRDYLRRVRGASQRMARLIDDLLALSRITRGEMRHENTDLGALAREVIDDLRKEQPERKVEIEVQRGIKVQADPNLLRVALDNLLRNAWKFTAREPRARIEVGAADEDGRTVYFVRDNGVGFDMKYADKLFGAFQRLHSDADFPGTGIGLATVQRVIRRHGGEIWAKAVPGKGATFFFTLGNGRER